MATEVAERLMSIDEFLEWESQQPFRHELIYSRVVAMTGVSRSHNRINMNLAFALEQKLEDRGCEVYIIEVGLLVDREGTYAYPDVIVVCGEPKLYGEAPQDTLQNPALLLEILSPSTESRDRNQKLDRYLEIPSLTGYFLVAQDKPLVEAHQRAGDEWRYETFAGLDASLHIPTPDCAIPLSEIYRRVRFKDA